MTNFQNNFPNQHNSAPQNSNRKTLGWILGILAGVTLVAIVTVVAYVQISDQKQKNSMYEIAERVIPEADWLQSGVEKPYISGGATCVSFDQACHVLFESWEATEPVDIEKIASQLGVPMEHTKYPEDCMRSTEGSAKIEICAYESTKVKPGIWFVSLRIREN